MFEVLEKNDFEEIVPDQLIHELEVTFSFIIGTCHLFTSNIIHTTSATEGMLIDAHFALFPFVAMGNETSIK